MDLRVVVAIRGDDEIEKAKSVQVGDVVGFLFAVLRHQLRKAAGEALALRLVDELRSGHLPFWVGKRLYVLLVHDDAGQLGRCPG